MFCKNCGKEINDDAKFCPECGARLLEYANIESKSNPESERHFNAMCLAGIIVSGISVFFNFYGLLGIAGLILSYMGYKAVKRSAEKGKELAIVGMVIGTVTTIIGLVSLIYLSYLYSAGISIISGLLAEI